MVNPKPTSRGRARVIFTRRSTLACSGRPNQRSPVLLAPPRRTADAGRSKHVHQLITGSFTVNTLPEPTLESKEICP